MLNLRNLWRNVRDEKPLSRLQISTRQSRVFEFQIKKFVCETRGNSTAEIFSQIIKCKILFSLEKKY